MSWKAWYSLWPLRIREKGGILGLDCLSFSHQGNRDMNDSRYWKATGIQLSVSRRGDNRRLHHEPRLATYPSSPFFWQTNHSPIQILSLTNIYEFLRIHIIENHKENNRNSTILFVAFTKICDAPSTPSQTVSSRATELPTGFTRAAWRQGPVAGWGWHCLWGSRVRKGSQPDEGDCPRLGIKALVSQHPHKLQASDTGIPHKRPKQLPGMKRLHCYKRIKGFCTL